MKVKVCKILSDSVRRRYLKGIADPFQETGSCLEFGYLSQWGPRRRALQETLEAMDANQTPPHTHAHPASVTTPSSSHSPMAEFPVTQPLPGRQSAWGS